MRACSLLFFRRTLRFRPRYAHIEMTTACILFISKRQGRASEMAIDIAERKPAYRTAEGEALPLLSGWLKKRSRARRSWVPRHFRVDPEECRLYYSHRAPDGTVGAAVGATVGGPTGAAGAEGPEAPGAFRSFARALSSTYYRQSPLSPTLPISLYPSPPSLLTPPPRPTAGSSTGRRPPSLGSTSGNPTTRGAPLSRPD